MQDTLRLQEKGPRPHVRFETRPVEDREKSIAQGHKAYKDVHWVIVTPPGGKDVREDVAEAWLDKIEAQAQNGQYDYEWAKEFRKMFAMYKDGLEMPVHGTPLRMCTTLFSPAEIANCAAVNVLTLEELAAANEETLGRIGMGSRALKTRAQEAIKTGEGKESAMKVEALTIENAALKQKVDDLIGVVNDLKEQMATMGTTEKRGAGRTARQQEAA